MIATLSLGEYLPWCYDLIWLIPQNTLHGRFHVDRASPCSAARDHDWILSRQRSGGSLETTRDSCEVPLSIGRRVYRRWRNRQSPLSRQVQGTERRNTRKGCIQQLRMDLTTLLRIEAVVKITSGVVPIQMKTYMIG